MSDKTAPRYGTLQIGVPVFRALKLAVAAERTSAAKVLRAELEKWLSNGRSMEPLPEELKDLSGWQASVDAEVHRQFKMACTEKDSSMARVTNGLIVGWLKRHGHGRLLDRFVAEAGSENKPAPRVRRGDVSEAKSETG